ncbi:MAG: ferredoxin [Candidatus Lambdaproteobacteria bacterium RIFOXYD2_FULL_50_16]|uniref:Ferredoxin n=1 Tax=Candidatus Lambdaproteobacteria bacterium RIFOXYD2_FULL_50_16 TaxID=1817772 RepID=A0A1F6GAY3_9PROT|nr:MAG: ferredoxin [Candidatus Lambdaproteobacteria bacterium RIFOXYD2_FULL_50_16]
MKNTRIVFVEKAECTSCQLCADELPDVFRMDEDDLAEVHHIDGAEEEEIQDSIDSCPGECIHWKDE